ncbi:Quinone oxidoreductase [Hondaea fermentalgiana]|uniref:Quinone oxidoreductase n=1 Tax=Hondaea fermentalgiana TaxID=2315210 RepID=A0A2R5GLL3_9STRA|nr:Quinone oxidoreductase [Hondaea fermentalgiana]|eukprot:GBG29513.1 Quinone oxidoreductase [Hondaea fermentalgiana]
MSRMMRAVRAGKGVVEMAVPSPEPGQVLVRTRAFGVNRPELLQHEGGYPVRPDQTDVLGLELAGVAEQSGEEVCALVGGGAYAEYCITDERLTLPIPFQGDDRFVRAAALPETTFTVWKNLFWDGPDTLKGKSVFVQAGASGIGTTAIAMAKAFGASRVTTTARDDERCKFCTDVVGADVCYNYNTEEWEKEEKADVILDMVGGSYLPRHLKMMQQGARLVILGFLGSPVTEKLNMTRVLLKNLTITGSVLRSAPDSEKARICEELKRHVWPRLASGEIALPHISHTFEGIDAYADAFEDMNNSKHKGKMVLRL